MMLIDSHIHLDFPEFDLDRDALLSEAKSKGIKRFIVPATTRASWVKIDRLSKEYNFISACYGIHPYFINAHDAQDLILLEDWIKMHACLAIGETGLDFYLKELDNNKQLIFFDAQLKIAKKYDLPVILHARKAVEAVTLSLKKFAINQGIIHSYNGSYEQAMRLIDMGFKLGFGGAITYPRATRLRSLVQQLPLDSICIETDAPDQPRFNFSHKRNEPLALLDVLETLSSLRKQPAELIAQSTARNCCDALNI